MRISDSERARIAEKLRERADDPWMELGDICEDIGCDVRRGEEAAVFRRLADLIEPDNIPDNADENAHGLSGSCDRDALLDLADSMDGYARFCKEHSIQVGSNLVECYADCIREAVNACEGDSDAPMAGDDVQGGTDAHMDGNEAAEGARTPSIEVLRWVEDNGGIEAVKKRLMPEGMEWDGSVLRIRTAENVDYDGETLFVLIGGRDFTFRWEDEDV